MDFGIENFVNRYKLDFYNNQELSTEGVLRSIFEAFRAQRPEQKIYVIIDEYDHFANELLGFDTDNFKNLLSKNGKIRKWYEVLKEGTESIVDRIFITGVAPITLDSLTSGFNISIDITQDERFNEMIGFTKEELIKLMEEEEISKQEQEELLPIMKENYDGYKFGVNGKEKIYNSNMSLYFLNNYVTFKRIPTQLVDMNIASDYSKVGKILDLCQGENRQDIIEKTVSGEEIISNITEKFNPAIEFAEKDLISMLYYLGYLTIVGEDFMIPKLSIPNKVMKEIYADYFMQLISKETDFIIQESEYVEITRQIALEGKIDKLVEMMATYLKNLSNRDFIQFSEKYVKLIFYCILMNLKVFRIKSEMEVERKYPDMLITPLDSSKGYASVIIEFKYLKKGEEGKLEEKQKEAREQIEEYAKTEEISKIEKLNKYTVVAVNDRIYVEQV